MNYPKIRFVCYLPTKIEAKGLPEHFDCAHQKHQIQIDPVRALPRDAKVVAIPGFGHTLNVLLNGVTLGWIKIEHFRPNVRKGQRRTYASVAEWQAAGSPQL